MRKVVKKRILTVVIGVFALCAVLAAILLPIHFCTRVYPYAGEDFALPIVDVEDIGEKIIVQKSSYYLAHPDIAECADGRILIAYPSGHGKGAIITKYSDDFGDTWNDLAGTPTSWNDSQETPTLYRLDYTDDEGQVTDRFMLLTSGCPKWPGQGIKADGFCYSLSIDDGRTFSEFTKLYGKEWAKNNGGKPYDCIVAMSSLTKLKEGGKFVNKWMGTFHDHDFINYKTILTFKTGENGELIFDERGFPIAEWSKPEPIFSEWREYEKKSQICEVEIIRGGNGGIEGDTLIAIARRNKHDGGSYIMFSDDEGESFSRPKALPPELTGDRHKAEYDHTTGKIVISFRHVHMGTVKSDIASYKEVVSLGWIGWVGTLDDLLLFRDGNPDVIGEKVVLFSKNYQGADCGYSGTACREGEFLFASYGTFDENAENPYIMAVKFKI